MIIKKGEREYSVTELSREWKAERVLGGGVRDSFRSRRMSPQKIILSFSHKILDICDSLS